MGIIAASQGASATDSNMSTHAQPLDDRCIAIGQSELADGRDCCL